MYNYLSMYTYEHVLMYCICCPVLRYEWIVPIKWIKTGTVQGQTYWLDKKEGKT